ncbi:MAG: ATP-binding protein [Planctomycetota bacterium]
MYQPLQARLTISSDIALLGLLGDWAVALARAVPGAEGAIDLELNLRLVLTELFSNCIRHAYNDTPDGQVEIEFKAGPGGIDVSVTDSGPGLPPHVDIDNLQLPEDNAQADAGRGLFLVRQLVDRLTYARANGRTTFSIRLHVPEEPLPDEALLRELLMEGQTSSST